VEGKDSKDRQHLRRRTAFRVRAGIATGVVTVGDAGSRDASDYTVLGDIANLGSRLESANKQFGTACLVNARTAELCRGQFLMRPLGRFRVVGRTEPVEMFEPLACAEQACMEQRALCDASSKMIALFQSGVFSACLEHLDSLESRPDALKLTGIYRDECKRLLRDLPNAPWDATIDLQAK
jgi:adenylate cyclase